VLPPERLDAIAPVFAKFDPDDAVARHRYLFSNQPALPEGRERDYKEHRVILATRRVDAARALYDTLGTQQIVEASTMFERSDALGDALAEGGSVASEDEPTLLLHALAHPEIRARAFGRAYLSQIQRKRGEETILTLVRDHAADWPATVRAEALLAMRAGPDTWNEADGLGNEGRTHYWQNVPGPWVEAADVAQAIRELARHGRPHAALDLAAMHVGEALTLSAENVAQVLLQAAPVVHDVTGYRSQSYDISELVTFLEREAEAGRIAEDEVARIELLYLPLLRDEWRPKLLHKAMGNDPSLFIEATCLAFRGEDEPERELDDETRGRALLAHELLESWRTPPGLEDGVIDGARLSEWVSEARRQLVEVNRTGIGDQLIGQILSGSPPGADGAWPAEPVRDVIEQLKSDDLEAGLHMGRFNEGDAVWRNPLSGGEMERSIQARYEADAATVAARWPRTAAFLRAFAATYERDAVREDVSAELRHDLAD
jgi:hypothetical protein